MVLNEDFETLKSLDILIDFDEGVPDITPREVGLALHHCPAVRLEPLRLEIQQHDSDSTRTVPNRTGVSRRTKQCAVYVVQPTLDSPKRKAKRQETTRGIIALRNLPALNNVGTADLGCPCGALVPLFSQAA